MMQLTRMIPGQFQSLRARLTRDPETRAQREQAAREAQVERELFAELKQEAAYYTAVIESRLEQLDICYRFTVTERKHGATERTMRVRIRRAIVSADAIYLQINTVRLPRGVPTRALIDPDVLDELTIACRCQVSARRNEVAGVWYIVERKRGVRGIPRMVRYSDMLAHMAQDAPPLAIPLGAGENGRLEYADLRDMPHLFVAGATGGGKSVFLNAVICTIIQRNPPERVRLTMIDLKGGVELSFYRGIPHLDAEIIEHEADVVPALAALNTEINRRLALFRDVCRDIRGWNQRHPKEKLPFHILVIDELASWSSPAMPKGARKEAEAYLSQIAAKGRAPGIHAIVCTQRPSVDVVAGLIKANFPTRVAFATASQVDSMTIIGGGEAYQLTPAGRMYMVLGAQRKELQAPYLTDEMVRVIVKQVIAGKVDLVDVARHDVAPEELFREALLELDGVFNVAELYKRFHTRGISRKEIYDLSITKEDQEIEIEGLLYRLAAGNTRKPRKLVQVGIEEMDSDASYQLPVAADIEKRPDPKTPEPLETSADLPTPPTAADQIPVEVGPAPVVAAAPVVAEPAAVVDRPADMNDQEAVLAWLAASPTPPKKRGGGR